MFRETIRKFREKLGYSLMEMLIVIGIIAITIGIATPAVSSIRRSMNLSQGNEYAKTIYMAAQNNLSEMRSMGELGMLESASQKDGLGWYCDAGPSYRRAYSRDDDSTSYDLIVPGTLDTAVRNQQVIIEYHPKAGIVYSVFYYEGKKDLEELYRDEDTNKLIRGLDGTEKERKKLSVGYYCIGDVDALVDQAFTVYQTSSTVSYENGQVGKIIVDVPIVDKKGDNMFLNAGLDMYNHYISGLEIVLTVTGENGGEYQETFTSTDATPKATFTPKNVQNLVSVEIPLDMLEDHKGFADNALNQPEAGTGNLIAAGDNISVTAEVTFYPTSDNDPLIMVESATIAGVNPMFHSLTQNPDHDPNAVANGSNPKPYILAVSNGRHLQNLSLLDTEFAKQIETIAFAQPDQSGAAPAAADLVLDWAETAAQYAYHKDLIPIDLSNLDQIPTIDGNGVEIRNLTISTAAEKTVNSSKVYYAGLFAELKDTAVKNIKLVDPQVSTTNATATGALAGVVTDTTITNCQVTNNSAGTTFISGSGTVGGLVGIATDGTTFDNCSTDATVKTGSLVLPEEDETLGDNIIILAQTDRQIAGGLVGSAEGGTKLDDCTSTARITGADRAEGTSPYQYLGGLVGDADNAELVGCVAESANVVSGQTTGTDSSNSDKNALGGLVGRAKNSKFKSSHSNSTTTVTSAKNAFSNLGGFVGYAETCTFGPANVGCSSNARVQGTDSGDTIPNNNLGGFVGWSKNSDYDTIEVNLNYLPQYAADAGGFAGLLVDGKVSDLKISFTGNTDAQKKATYFGGVASRIRDGAEVDDAEVTCASEIKLVHATYCAGFACYNGGTITNSFANVIMDKGSLFVMDNTYNSVGGAVRNCYGWVWGEGNSIKVGSGCKSSYFVDGLAAAKGESEAVILYDSTGDLSDYITDTEALADAFAVTLLNGDSETPAWTAGSESGYPYPTLERAHTGDWSKPKAGKHPYALLYVEEYGDSDEVGTLLTSYDKDGNITDVVNKLGSGEVKTATFYLCHRSSGYGTPVQSPNTSAFGFGEDNWLYTVSELDTGTYETLKLHTYYPVNRSGINLIRTTDQFGNIAADGAYYLDNTFSITESIPVFYGTLTSDNRVTITASVPLVNTLTGGKIDSVTVAPQDNFAGNGGVFVGKASGGIITGCTVTHGISGKPFVTYDAEELSGVTHSSTVKNESIKYVSESEKANFTPASDAGVSPVTITDCSIGEKAAADTVYYYSIGTDLVPVDLDEEFAVSFQIRPFSDLAADMDAENASRTASTYYAKDGNYYYANVTVTYTANGDKYTFDFGSDTSVTLSASDVPGKYEAGGVTLYELDGSVNISGQYYLIECDGGYVVANGSDVKIADQSSTNAMAYLWTGNGDGTLTNAENTGVKVTLAAGNGADSMFQIMHNRAAIAADDSISAAKFDLRYECDYMGAGYDMYIP